MKRFPVILLIIKIYLLGILFFSLFRIILFLTELDKAEITPEDSIAVFQSFLMGFRFDTVISGYILLLPAFILFVLSFLPVNLNKIKPYIFYWVFAAYSLSFIICTADIPYFNQFFERFTVGAFKWFDNTGFVFSMIFQEPEYFGYLFVFLLLDAGFYVLLKRIFKQPLPQIKGNIAVRITSSLVFLFLIFLGIRGRIEQKSPIRIGTAYFSDHAFLNKLGLNPVFTFIRSYLDSQNPNYAAVHLMDDKQAVLEVRKQLSITDNIYDSPIARKITPDSLLRNKPNVVIIIMESMSAAKMSYFGNPNHLTPFLDSLAKKSIFFDNFYSTGKHTFNGIFSTLFSFPALYRQHPMKYIRKYDGIATALSKHNYSTTYFTTHDGQFDNVEGFLRANDFQNIVSVKDYPPKEVKTTLGVPDDYMFRFAVPYLNNLHQKNKPFLSVFMTASDHGPYYVPEYFKPKSSDIKQQIVEYADWSLHKFFDLAKQQAWYSNTIFALVADHGAYMHAQYELPLNYFHIPFIIYSPLFSKNKVKTYNKIGSQTDVFPTLMGLLKLDYINNTLGIDLLNEDREYALLNDDDKTGILDQSFLCIMKDYGKKSELYKYKNGDKTNYSSKYPEKVKEMTHFAKAQLQVTQQFISGKIPSVTE